MLITNENAPTPAESFTITPTVNAAQEFVEIANDFANPLDLIREAISNAFDAKATDIRLAFQVEEISGEPMFVVRITDNGAGMDRTELQSFFDLGNSTRRGDNATIGEKGHGTKVYFNCKRLEVDTQKNGERLVAHMDAPFTKLHARQIPEVVVSPTASETKTGATAVTIYGYNNNRRERFTHARVKDHIIWFTKFGSIEKEFGVRDLEEVKLHIKGLDVDEFETLDFGHVFPKESKSVNDLFEEHTVQAPNYYSRRLNKSGSLPRHPEIRYSAVFSVEGKRVKYGYNEMIRRPGYAAPEGSYTLQDRYGLWICKDFIPVQRKNDWVTTKGNEFTRLHAFFNCQALKLTANRGSVENTPAELLQDIEDVVKKVYREITESSEWLELDYLEEEADSFNTVEKEKKSFGFRIDKVNHANIAVFKETVLIEPKRESGVHALVVQLMTLEPDLFPFTVLDYDTHEGIDLLVKAKDKVTVTSSKLYYLEFKYLLSKNFNHSFENLYSVICWDTDLKNGDVVQDVAKEERKLSIIAPESEGDRTRYFLDNPRKAHRIEVLVLKDFLPQVLGLEFRPRTEADIV